MALLGHGNTVDRTSAAPETPHELQENGKGGGKSSGAVSEDAYGGVEELSFMNWRRKMEKEVVRVHKVLMALCFRMLMEEWRSGGVVFQRLVDDSGFDIQARVHCESNEAAGWRRNRD